MNQLIEHPDGLTTLVGIIAFVVLALAVGFLFMILRAKPPKEPETWEYDGHEPFKPE